MIRTAAVLSIIVSAPALAQGPCAPHDDFARTLADRYGERLVSVALDAGGAVIEWWGNAETGSWTLTVTRPGGPTCLVSGGNAWELVPPLPEGDPA